MVETIFKLVPIRPTDPDSWPDILTGPVKRLLEYWVSKNHAGRYPGLADIEPREIVPILPYIFIVDRLDSGKSDYRFRLVGTQIVEIEGECTGRFLSGMFPDRDRYADIWKQYDECCLGTIYVRHQNLGWKGKMYIDYETVLLPLHGNGGNVDNLIGAAHGMLS